jgi:hypothetical protein
VLLAAGITFILHATLQWFSWEAADGIGKRHQLPFSLLSFPVLWLAPRAIVNGDFELCMVLNSAIWAGVVGLLLMRSQHRQRTHQRVLGE